MRMRSLLAAAGVLAASLTYSYATALAAPAGCRNNAKGFVEFCDQFDPTVRNRGGIGLLGDSVLLGSTTGMSTPSLPTMLATSGWGPIRSTTSLGMKTYFAGAAYRDASAFHWMGRWKAAGFVPRAIAVNLGANHLTTCTAANPAPCKAAIDQLLREIDAQFPGATVWWAKVVQRSYPSGAFSSGMLGWNLALDQAAAERGNLMLWDWPSALLSANPAIITDLGSIHPVSGVEYVKRSTLMAEQLNLLMPANFVGPRVTPPDLGRTPMAFLPVAATTVYDTTAPDIPGLAADAERDIDLSAAAPGAGGVALTVTGTNASAGGFLRLYACGDPPPATSNLNFQPGVTRTAQALIALSGTQHLCAYSNVDVDITVALQGVFTPGTGDTFFPIAPIRQLDTRLTGRAPLLTVATPAADAVAVSVVVVGQSGGGTITIYRCDAPAPVATSLGFVSDEVVAGAAFVAVSAESTICVRVDTADDRLVDVIVDITGTFQNDPGGLRFSPVGGTRLLDTRIALGGWYGRHARGQSIDLVAAPNGTEAVSGTVTMVRPLSASHLRAYGCGSPLPPTSVVNAQPGLVSANNVTSGLDPFGPKLCIWAAQNADTLFDVMGYWVRAAA